MITNSEVSDWLKIFDVDAEVLVTAIANNEIKIEEMIDSIHAFSVGKNAIAKQRYKDMFR